MAATETNALMSLDSAIRDICAYLGDDLSERYYIKVARVLKHVMYQLNIHVTPTVKSVPLAVTANFTAQLPDDVDVITKVGVCCSNGSLKLLGRNDALTLKAEEQFFQCCSCNTEPIDCHCQEMEHKCDSCTFHNLTDNLGDDFSFGIGSGAIGYQYLYGYTPQQFTDTGYYRHDVESGTLVLSGGCQVKDGSMIICEYSASLSIQGYQLIPRKMYLTLQHRVAQQIKMNNSPSAANLELDLFRREYDMLKRTYHTYTLEDFIAALRGGYKSSPKR